MEKFKTLKQWFFGSDSNFADIAQFSSKQPNGQKYKSYLREDINVHSDTAHMNIDI